MDAAPAQPATTAKRGVIPSRRVLGGTLGVVTVLYALSIGPLVHLLLPRFAVSPPEAVS